MKFKGIKQALREYKTLCKRGWVVMMVDLSDGEVWTDFFPSESEWKVYKSESIKSIDLMRIYFQNNGNLTEEGLIQELEEMKKEEDR